MTGPDLVAHPALVRDYERLCALFPHAYRREHQAELLCHLVEAAPAGATRASAADRLDLLRAAAREWLLAPLGSGASERRDATRWLLVLVPLVMLPAAVTRLYWVATALANGRGLAHVLDSEPAAPAWALWFAAMVVFLTGGLRAASVLATTGAALGWAAIVGLSVAGQESTAFIEVGWVVGLTFAAMVLAQRAGWTRPLGARAGRRAGVAVCIAMGGVIGWSAMSPWLPAGSSWSIVIRGLPPIAFTSGVAVAPIVAGLAVVVWSRSARQAAPALAGIVSAVISARVDLFGDRLVANGQVNAGHVVAVVLLSAVAAAVARWVVNRLDETAAARERLRTSPSL